MEPKEFYLDKEEPIKSTLFALREIIFAQDPEITATTKYGMPCFLYRKNILCYLWTDRKTGEPYILMAEGNHLHHPALEKGSRARMKILRIDPYSDLPVLTIEEVLQEGIDLYTKGVVKMK